MEKDPNYLLQLLGLAWEAAERGVVVIDFFIALIVVFIIRGLEKRNKIPEILSRITQHPIFEDDKWRLAMTFAVIFILQIIFISPYSLYKKNHAKIEEQQKLLDDKSPKLEGFVNRVATFDEGATTNSVMFIEVSVSNLGGAPSAAEEYGLKVILSTNASANVEELKFSDEYKLDFVHKEQPWVLDLKRRQLIAEKTTAAIPVGEHKRGWLAYRLYGIKTGQFALTNIVFSFVDINGNRIAATNGFWMGRQSILTNTDDFATVIPGAENIFYPVPPEVRTNWLPPELPPGCGNVVIFFGARGIVYPRLMAEMSPEGTTFAIKDLPDFYLKDLDKMPGYSPSQKFMQIKHWETYSIGGKTVPYPVQPIIISNRLYVEVEIPFVNEKRKIVMSDDFDPELPIPPQWDRNYSTNYFSNGIKSGGIYAYEVVNELTNPVLQVVYSAPNEVHINGIFQVDSNSILAAFEEQPQLFTFIINDQTNGITTASLQSENFHETFIINSNETIASLGQRLTNEFFRPIFKNQRTFFKYPSNRGNIGVLADWLLETNKSDTKTLDSHK